MNVARQLYSIYIYTWPPVVHESSNGPGRTFVRPHCTGTSDVHHYTVYGVMYRAAVSPGWLWWSEILISSVSVQQCCKEHRIHDLYLSSLVCNHQEIKVTVVHNEAGKLTWNFVLTLQLSCRLLSLDCCTVAKLVLCCTRADCPL